MKVSLSPFATPFVPGVVGETGEERRGAELSVGLYSSSSASETTPTQPMEPTCFAPFISGPIDNQSPELDVWFRPDVFTSMGNVPPTAMSPSFYPGQPPTAMPHYPLAVPNLMTTCGIYDPSALGSYLYTPTNPPTLGLIGIEPDQRTFGTSSRRRNRKARASKSGKDGKSSANVIAEGTYKERMNNSKSEPQRQTSSNKAKSRPEERRPPLICKETANQTDFRESIAECSLVQMPSPFYQSSTGDSKTQHVPPFERVSIAAGPSDSSDKRTIAVWTDSDLLRPPPPPPTRVKATPAVFSYAAALKHVPVAQPKAPSAPVADAASPDNPRVDKLTAPPAPHAGKKEKKSKKSKKKKVKAPVIDLEAVMAEQEAARTSTIHSITGGDQQPMFVQEEFPDLASKPSNHITPKSVPSVWGNISKPERQPGILPVRPSETHSGPTVRLLEAASVRNTKPSRPEISHPPAPKEPESVGKLVHQKPSRTKFMPLFSIGGSGTGSAQTSLFRPKDLPATSSFVSPKALDIKIPDLSTGQGIASIVTTRKATDISGKRGATNISSLRINPLDSTVTKKRGKEREKPKAKRPTPMKQIILRERQVKKEKRRHSLVKEEKDEVHDPGSLSCPETRMPDKDNDTDSDSDSGSNAGEAVSAPEEGGMEAAVGLQNAADAQPLDDSKSKDTSDDVVENWETLAPDEVEPKTIDKAENNEAAMTTPGLHSRRFREYCDQMIGKAVNECVLAILADLVRFQDRLHQRDPVKARQRRRLIYGIKEVTKHLRMGRVRLVIISPDVEKIESKGGLDEAIHTILDLCTEQSIPHVFSLPRRLLGRACMKAVSVSVVGVFNYSGTEQNVRRLVELVEEGRRQYRLVTRIMEHEESGTVVDKPENNRKWQQHSRNASNVSEPISDVAGGHSRQSSVGGPLGVVLRRQTGTAVGEYEADDEAEEA